MPVKMSSPDAYDAYDEDVDPRFLDALNDTVGIPVIRREALRFDYHKLGKG